MFPVEQLRGVRSCGVELLDDAVSVPNPTVDDTPTPKPVFRKPRRSRLRDDIVVLSFSFRSSLRKLSIELACLLEDRHRVGTLSRVGKPVLLF